MKKNLFWWTDEMFYKESTPFGKVIINVVAPFVYGAGYLKGRFERLKERVFGGQ